MRRDVTTLPKDFRTTGNETSLGVVPNTSVEEARAAVKPSISDGLMIETSDKPDALNDLIASNLDLMRIKSVEM
jgi:hypothetical protein